MSPWAPWSAEAFARARAEGKPLLAAPGSRPPAGLAAFEEELEKLFVLVLADAEARPDAAARLGGRAVTLAPDGARRAVLDLSAPGLAEALPRLAADAARPAAFAGPADSAWTGAVRGTPLKEAPGDDRVAAALAALVDAPLEPSPLLVEGLLHCAGERGDAAAAAALPRALDALLARRDGRGALSEGGEPGLALNARWAALLWDAHALTGEPRWRDAAEGLTSFLLDVLRDVRAGAFRRAPNSAVLPAEGNALAASALIRAAAFDRAGAMPAALAALAYVRERLHDPLLGLVHASGADVHGLLGDAARAALAATDAFVATGDKTHREFADGLLRFMFQELWEREAGGFLDRVARADDPAILREPRVDPELNAAALEVCRRLHHLKGNHNYRRWLEWGLRGAWPARGGDVLGEAALARAADLHARGRLDLELVGRAGEPAADALLAAAHRLYLPRKIVSFVDPDDQDYIMAHKLEADSYPRLFACGPDLRRVADAADPAGVPALAAALKGVRS